MLSSLVLLVPRTYDATEIVGVDTLMSSRAVRRIVSTEPEAAQSRGLMDGALDRG